MLANYIGNNLSRLTGEIDKLIVRLGDNKKITSDIIEGNIGISKEYNNFELLKAIINKDLYKANLICSFFAKDPKNNPFVLTLSVLFSYPHFNTRKLLPSLLQTIWPSYCNFSW